MWLLDPQSGRMEEVRTELINLYTYVAVNVDCIRTSLSFSKHSFLCLFMLCFIPFNHVLCNSVAGSSRAKVKYWHI